MDVLRTVAVDIQHSVFENETAAIMYVTKDIYNDTYVIAIPVITFSWVIWEGREDQDYKDLANANIFGDKDKQGRLIQAIKEAIEEF